MDYFLFNIFTEPTSMESFQRLEMLSSKEEILLHWNRFGCGGQNAWALSRTLRRKKQLNLDLYWLRQSWASLKGILYLYSILWINNLQPRKSQFDQLWSISTPIGVWLTSTSGILLLSLKIDWNAAPDIFHFELPAWKISKVWKRFACNLFSLQLVALWLKQTIVPIGCYKCLHSWP